MADSVNDLPITLELTVNKVNVILRSLGKHPFDEVNLLIADIKRQGEFQVQLWTEKLEAYAAQEQIAEENVKIDKEAEVLSNENIEENEDEPGVLGSPV